MNSQRRMLHALSGLESEAASLAAADFQDRERRFPAANQFE
jgi:hypothetical protein